MSGFQDKTSKFWKELKDRRVLRSTTVYVAAVFGLLEMIDIISSPLHLPDWVLTVCIFLFIAGLPLTIVVSWLFYFSPEGIRRYGRPGLPDPGFIKADDLIPVEDEPVEDRLIQQFEGVEGRKAQTGRIYGISSLVLICVVAAMFLFYGGKAADFSERDWIVLADFVNHTGEEIFEHSLNTAFEISINQSRHINVLTRSRVQEVLKRIGKDSEARIDEELCREIASREGMSVYIIPEISRVGGQYILTAKLVDSESSNVLISEIFYSKNKDEILDKLDRISKRMRRHLGESRYKISGQDKTLEKVTTSSLDALKQYSLGFDSHIRLDFNSAVTYYENAIRLDSNFTAAKASLGNILYEHFDREKGKYWLDEAMKTLDKLTESERLSILAFYAANEEKNLDKSIEYTRMQIELYPDKVEARNNLAWYLKNRGDYEESTIEYKEAIRLDPYLLIPYAGLIDNYQRFLGQTDSALVWSKKLIRVAPENGYGHFYLGSSYFAQDLYELAEQEFEQANRLTPGVFIIMYRLAHTYRVLEKYGQAVEVLNEILRIDKQQSAAYYNLGVCYGLMGLEDKARENYHTYVSFTEYWEKTASDNPTTFFYKGVVLTRLGKMEEGLEAGRKGYGLDTSYHFDFARLLAAQGRTTEALDQLEMALENGYRHLVWIKMEPEISQLKDEPRYQELLERYFL